MATEPSARSPYRSLYVMAFLLLVIAPLEYLHIVHFTGSGGRSNHPNPDSAWQYVLYAMPLIVLPAYSVVERVHVSGHRRGIWRKPTSLKEALHTIVIIRLAFLHSIYIYGLANFFITGKTQPLYYFYSLGILASIFYWPTRARLDELAAKMEAP